MPTVLWVALLSGGGFGLIAPRWSRRLPPAVATWLLSVGGLLAGAASSTAIALVAFRVLAQTRPFSAQGHWSDAVLRERDPISLPLAIAMVTTLVLCLAPAVGR